MARTELTLQTTTRAGIAPTYTAATVDGFAVNNEYYRVILHVKNGNASPCTVTVQTPGTVDGLAIPDLTVVVPATTGDKMIGPFPGAVYNVDDSATTGVKKALIVTFSVQASVTVAAFKVGSTSY